MANNKIVDFHPAVLTARTMDSNRKLLAMFARYAEQDGGVMKVQRNFSEISLKIHLIATISSFEYRNWISNDKTR